MHWSEVPTSENWNVLMTVRKEHGFRVNGQQARNPVVPRAKDWSKRMLDTVRPELEPSCDNSDPSSEDSTWVPKNASILDFIKQRFEGHGFDWETAVISRPRRNGTIATSRVVRYTNYPTVAGIVPTLYDLLVVPIDLVDPPATQPLQPAQKQSVDRTAFNRTNNKLTKTGIGYKGIEGASWLLSQKTFVLPQDVQKSVETLGSALFHFYDAVADLYSQSASVRNILAHKAPRHIPRYAVNQPLSIVRPDIVLVVDQSGTHRLVVTELESAPAGQGMVHAIQHAYDQPETVVETLVEFLDGRPYIVAIPSECSEFLWDQIAICRALAERGVKVSIVFDCPLETVADDARRLWVPSRDTARVVRSRWNRDVSARLEQIDTYGFVKGFVPQNLPDSVGNAVVYRFGYFDNFCADTLHKLALWQKNGATIINGMQFYLENKALMACLGLPDVRQRVHDKNPDALTVLDESIAMSRLLSTNMDRAVHADLLENKKSWVTKIGAWDGDNQSWGSRGIVFGAEETQTSWVNKLKRYMNADYPVIAQRVISSSTFDIPYFDRDGSPHTALNQRTRLTPYLMRTGDGTVKIGGEMITFNRRMRVHGSTDSIQGPVVYGTSAA